MDNFGCSGFLFKLKTHSKGNGLNNDKNDCGRKNACQKKLQYYVYVRNGETNTLNTHLPARATF